VSGAEGGEEEGSGGVVVAAMGGWGQRWLGCSREGERQGKALGRDESVPGGGERGVGAEFGCDDGCACLSGQGDWEWRGWVQRWRLAARLLGVGGRALTQSSPLAASPGPNAALLVHGHRVVATWGERREPRG
jgi:hypothetical protein